MILRNSIVSLDIGGRDIANYLKRILSNDIQLKRDLNGAAISDSLVNHIRDHICEVSFATLDSEKRKDREVPRMEFEYNGEKVCPWFSSHMPGKVKCG